MATSIMSMGCWTQIKPCFTWFCTVKHFHRALTACQLPGQAVQEVETVEYPPIKPRFPSGKWGYMTPGQAWKWHDESEQIKEIADVKHRIDKLCNIPERSVWLLSLESKEPALLPYQQYLTKTHLVKDLPSIYRSIDVENELESVRHLVQDAIVYENELLRRDHYFDNYNKPIWHHSAESSRLLVGNILRTLTSFLSGKCDYLRDSIFDECVRVEAHWHRHGIAKKGRHGGKLPRPQHSPFQTNFLADCQIRTKTPILPFLQRDDSVCLDGEYPHHLYHPLVLGLHSEFGKPSIVPGYWLGDPCQFGLLSAQVTNTLDQMETQYGADVVRDMRTGCGIVTSFAWLVAQAHYQGFSMYVDMTYPFCTQTILTNGQRFSFFTYQLNTLQLWQDDDGNAIRNVCWHSDEANLFETVEDGQIKGFNDDVLRNILRFLMNSPRTDDIDLRSTTPCDGTSSAAPQCYIEERAPPPPSEEEAPLY